MTPSQQAKALGLKSLNAVVAELGTNERGNPMVSRQTLTSWHRNKPDLFRVVLAGVKAGQHIEGVK